MKMRVLLLQRKKTDSGRHCVPRMWLLVLLLLLLVQLQMRRLWLELQPMLM